MIRNANMLNLYGIVYCTNSVYFVYLCLIPHPTVLLACVCVCVFLCGLCVCMWFVCARIQGVTGGTDQTSGECSLGQTIPI